MFDKEINIKQLVLIYIQNFLLMLSYNTILILPDHLEKTGASKFYIGFFMNVPSIMLALYVIFISWWITKFFNRKTILIFGFSVFFVSSIIMYFFYNNLYILMILRMLSSISYAVGFTLLFSFFYDFAPLNKRTGAAAVYGTSGIISGPIGSFLGEKISEFSGAQYLFIMICIFSFVSIILPFFIKEKTYSKINGSVLSFFSNIIKPDLIILIIIAAVFGGAYSILATFIPNFSEDRLGKANISMYFVAFSIIAVSTRIFFFRLFDIIKKKYLIIIALTFMAFSMFFTVFLKYYWQLFIIGFFYGTAHSLLFPTLSVLFVNKSQNEDEKMKYNNLYLCFNMAGSAGFSSFFGFIGDFTRTEYIFILPGIIILTVLGFSLIKKKF